MRVISEECVTEWVNVANRWTPRSIDTNCPFCHRAINLALAEHNYDQRRKTMAASARCSGCDEDISIWVVDPGPSNDSSKKGCSCLAIFPAAQDMRGPIEGASLLPDSLKHAYQEALQVYNARIWSATATLCRRTLEGIVLHLCPKEDDRTNLAQMLRKLPNNVDLAKPITSLADSVRLGGNIGSHFDTESEPDERLATAMLDLIEYLMEYVFTLPKMIENLKNAVDKTDPAVE
jgi:hypothetical protein